MKAFLQKYSKSMTMSNISAILDSRTTTSPAVLMTMLSILRDIAKHDNIDSMLNSFLKCPDIDCLHHKLLDLLETEFSKQVM